MTTLDLGRNAIGDEGAKTIAEALKVNTFLTTLNLGHNAIGDEGAKTIAEALKAHIFLTKLVLNGNSIGDKLINDIQKLVSNKRKTGTELENFVKHLNHASYLSTKVPSVYTPAHHQHAVQVEPKTATLIDSLINAILSKMKRNNENADIQEEGLFQLAR